MLPARPAPRSPAAGDHLPDLTALSLLFFFSFPLVSPRFPQRPVPTRSDQGLQPPVPRSRAAQHQHLRHNLVPPAASLLLLPCSFPLSRVLLTPPPLPFLQVAGTTKPQQPWVEFQARRPGLPLSSHRVHARIWRELPGRTAPHTWKPSPEPQLPRWTDQTRRCPTSSTATSSTAGSSARRKVHALTGLCARAVGWAAPAAWPSCSTIAPACQGPAASPPRAGRPRAALADLLPRPAHEAW